MRRSANALRPLRAHVAPLACLAALPLLAPACSAGDPADDRASTARDAGALDPGAPTASPSPPAAPSGAAAPPLSASPHGAPGPLHPGAAPSLGYYVVTAGDINALYRTIAPNDPSGDWRDPLRTMQSQMLVDTLGLKDAADENGSPGYAGGTATTVSCHFMASFDFDSGTGSEKDIGPCHYVDDMTSSDPSTWTLGNMGDAIVRTIEASPHAKDVLLVSLVLGETDAKILHDDGLAGGAAGSPYESQWSDPAARAEQFKQGFSALLRLLRDATHLPRLRIALQVFVGAGGDDAVDLLQSKEIEAANESNGTILLGNANPLQWVTNNDGFEGYRYYTGRSYMDLALETGRVVARAIGRAGLGDTLAGPCYGEFPAITKVTAAGATIVVDVSNPNGASTLKLPADALQGWDVIDGTTFHAVASVALSAPFQLTLTLAQPLPPGAIPRVTYGDHYGGDKYPALTAGGAVTDDASQLPCAEATALPRHDMPLALKPL